jgi:diguanylate cyclase (GGDEF)-like protein
MPQLTAIVRIGDPQRTPRTAGPRGSRRPDLAAGILAVPIEIDGAALGFVGFLEDDALAGAGRRAGRVLARIAAEAAIPACNALRHAEALEAALKDPLTGLYNRRALVELLDREVRGSMRYGRSLALVLLDLDNLKAINDSRGHSAGDAALRALGSVLLEFVRRADLCARLGGDEFAVACPDTTAEDARRAGQRIERAFGARETALADGTLLCELGVSFGVSDLAAVVPGSSADPDAVVAALLHAADTDLYATKAARRQHAAARAGGMRA